MRNYWIAEIFRSIQGEGAHTGKPAVFIRFAGCNLNCEWCDTDHECSENLTLDQLVAKVQGVYRQDDIVVLTGGEPTVQVDQELLRALSQYPLHLETNGTNDLPGTVDWVTVSPKSIESVVLTRADEVKVVLGGDISPSEARGAIVASHYFIQPLSECYAPAIEYILVNPGWRLSVQVHKAISIP